MHRTIAGFLFAPRPLPLLLLLSTLLATAQAAQLFSPSFVFGTASYWQYPAGLVDDSVDDMANVLVGYYYAVKSPWTVPLLYSPFLDAPAGMSVVWLDAMPLVVLAGKLVRAVTGEAVNLLGIYVLACFVLPGPVMTWALATAQVRNLAGMAVGTAFAVTMPILLWRWGHLALCAQFLLLGALVLYRHTVSMPHRWRFAAQWSGYLMLCLSINNYLFVMAGAVFAAALAQRWYGRVDDWRGTAAAGATAFLSVVAGMAAIGYSGGGLRSTGTFGFGYYSTNLLSPVYPQGSGLFPGFDETLDATGGQYEGVAYLGAGLLLATVFTAPLLIRWLRANWRRHVMLLVVLAGCCIMALSHRVFAGDLLLLDLPLPANLVHKLGMFRSAGRFIWLPEYALLCAVLVLALRYTERHGRALALFAGLAGLVVVQVADTAPLRRAIAENVQAPFPSVLEPAALAPLLARAGGIKVYPTYACSPRSTAPWYLRANMALLLTGASAARPLPINSFYNARPKVDCGAERRERATEALTPAILHVYLDGIGPTAAQLDAAAAARFCGDLGRARYCLIPGPDG